MKEKSKNTWICEQCSCEYSNLITYCRKCALKERIDRRKNRIKYGK